MPERRGAAARGFALIWLLFVVAALGVGLAAIGNVWHSAAVREKERQLLFVGDQYRAAIQAFHAVTDKGPQRYPKSIDELLADPRYLEPVRHLRRPYPDPLTGSAEWGLVKDADGGIAGVYSLSAGQPFKSANFPPADQAFEGTTQYSEWVFSAETATATDTATTADAGTGQEGDTGEVPAPVPPRTSPCYEQMHQAIMACAEYVRAGKGNFGECRNAAVAQYQGCSGR